MTIVSTLQPGLRTRATADRNKIFAAPIVYTVAGAPQYVAKRGLVAPSGSPATERSAERFPRRSPAVVYMSPKQSTGCSSWPSIHLDWSPPIRSHGYL
jgi:hypothetical protein